MELNRLVGGLMDKYIAFIPVRGGSKSIPFKNIKLLAGKPLVYWTIRAAQLSEKISKIYVSTDSPKIKEVVNKFNFHKLQVLDRSKNSASDTASTESAMLEFASQYEFENIILLQATSPLTTSQDIDGAITLYEKGYDSVLSAVNQKRFLWQTQKQNAVSLNYNIFKRPRRQEFEGQVVENGAIYITSKVRLLKTKNRISGKIKIYKMAENTYFEIDEPSDWIIMEALMRQHSFPWNEALSNLKVLAFDVDGVFTQGDIFYSKEGEAFMRFNRVDGKGIELARKAGFKIWIISAEESAFVRKRMEKLQADEICLGIKNKIELLQKLQKKYSLSSNEIGFMGDDVQDLEVIQNCGFSGAPENAVNSVKNSVNYICKRKGGDGAVREFIDFILKN